MTAPDTPPFVFERSGRRPLALIVILAVWVLLLWLWLGLGALWGLVAIGWLITLPALMDFVRNRRSGLRVEGDRLIWFSGKAGGEVVLDAIERVQFDGRMDFSTRVRLFLTTPGARRVTLPQDVLPPWQDLLTALEARNVPCRRNPFSLF